MLTPTNHPFQGYYVNLLKTISLKLNEVTVQFFFQQLPGGSASFPLYTGAPRMRAHRVLGVGWVKERLFGVG